MLRRSPRALGALLLLAVLASGCDSSSDVADDLPASATTDTEDAALNVAAALATDGGGVLEDAAAAASTARPAGGLTPAVRPGCRPTTTFDRASMTYTTVSDCARTGEAGRFSASFSRVTTARYLGADGQPQADRASAEALDYAIVSGSSTTVSPRGSHRLLSLTATFAVTDLGQDLVTVNGTYARASADTLRSARGERTLTSELSLTLTDVRGPRGVQEGWHRGVSGTITGTYHAVQTGTGRDGTPATREITRDIDITLPRGGSDVAEINVGGRRFTADRRTGAVQEIR